MWLAQAVRSTICACKQCMQKREISVCKPSPLCPDIPDLHVRLARLSLHPLSHLNRPPLIRP